MRSCLQLVLALGLRQGMGTVAKALGLRDPALWGWGHRLLLSEEMEHQPWCFGGSSSLAWAGFGGETLA